MGNSIGNSIITNKGYNGDEKYTDNYTWLKDDQINKIREQYKVIDVDWLSTDTVHYQMFGDKYFDKSTNGDKSTNCDNSKTKEEIINSMLVYYLNRHDRAIYRKTDYLCNEREKICICNTHAEDFRKIYDGINYKEGDKYISWFREKKHRF